MSNFRQVKDRQLQILTDLKATNGELGEIRPRLADERAQNKANKTDNSTVKAEYDTAMAKRAELLKQLETVNAELEIARADKKANVSEQHSKRAADSEAKKLEREAKAVERKKTAELKAAEKAAAHQARAAERDKRRAERAEELEEKGHSAAGYNIPLLTELDHFVGGKVNEAFAITHEVAKEINDRKRRDHIDQLVNAL